MKIYKLVKAKEDKCSFCGEKGHDISNCMLFLAAICG